jgi:branched-chain amino acid transport system substrate-binding protein
VRHGLSRTADPASQRDDHPEEKRPMIPLERVARGMIAVVALATFMGGAGSSAAQPAGPLKIGFIYPDNGPMAQLGLDLRDGFLLYWSEVGQKAGGRPVEVLVETKASCKPDEGLTKARKLVERDHVHVLGGIVCTPVAYALRPYVIDKKIPFVVMNAGANELTMKRRSPYILRSSFSNSDGSHPLGEWLFKQGYRRRRPSERPHRVLSEHHPVLEVDPGAVHGDAVVCRDER